MANLDKIGKSIAPWRFLMFFALLALGWGIGLSRLGWSQGLLVGFDVAAVVFLMSCVPIFADDVAKMRAVAAQNDANRAVLLGLSFLLTVVILAAIVAELGQDTLGPWDKALVAISLVLVWTFGNAVYTLHYCHLFYTGDDGGKDCAGLDFPRTKEPLMSDFVYFAFTIGAALQTSDVDISSPHIRTVATAHTVISFFFNLGVLALTINVLGAS